MTMTQPGVTALWDDLCARVEAGDRFAGLFGTQPAGGPLVLSAHVATAGGIDTLEAPLPPGAAGYPALTPRLGAAFWYERVIHDRFGVVPAGHPRLAPLIRPGTPEEYAAAPARGRLRRLHDPARAGPLRGDGVDRVPGRDARRGDPAPEHAGVLQAPRRGGPVRRDDRRPTACCWPNAPRASPRSPTPWPSATRSRRSRAASRLRPRAWSGCCTPNWSGSPTTSTSPSGWPTRPGSRWPPPGSRCTRSGCMRLVSALCGSRFGRGVVVPGGVGALPLLPPAQIWPRRASSARRSPPTPAR